MTLVIYATTLSQHSMFLATLHCLDMAWCLSRPTILAPWIYFIPTLALILSWAPALLFYDSLALFFLGFPSSTSSNIFSWHHPRIPWLHSLSRVIMWRCHVSHHVLPCSVTMCSSIPKVDHYPRFDFPHPSSIFPRCHHSGKMSTKLLLGPLGLLSSSMSPIKKYFHV